MNAAGNRPQYRNPTLPALPWDHGAKGPANLAGIVIEDATDIDPETGRESANPNRVTRARRIDRLEAYEAQGILTRDQANIARELRAAAEGARTADPLAALGRKIDRTSGTPDPLAVAFDSRRKFHRMWALIPSYARAVVDCVILEDRPIREMPGCRGSGPRHDKHADRLRRGLDELRAKWAGR